MRAAKDTREKVFRSVTSLAQPFRLHAAARPTRCLLLSRCTPVLQAGLLCQLRRLRDGGAASRRRVPGCSLTRAARCAREPRPPHATAQRRSDCLCVCVCGASARMWSQGEVGAPRRPVKVDADARRPLRRRQSSCADGHTAVKEAEGLGTLRREGGRAGRAAA